MPIFFVSLDNKTNSVSIKPQGNAAVTIVSASLTGSTDAPAVVTFSSNNESGVVACLSNSAPQSTAFSSIPVNTPFTLATTADVNISIALSATTAPTIVSKSRAASELAASKRVRVQETIKDEVVELPKVAEAEPKKKVVEKVAEKAAEKTTEAPKKQENEKSNKKNEKQERVEPSGKVVTLAGGLQMKDIEIGTGHEVANGRRVSIRYQGMFSTGQVFDTNMPRGTPLQLTLGSGELIKGLDNGLVGMKRGGKRRLIIPPSLGYGINGVPPTIPPNSTLIFDVEVIKC